MLSHIVSNVRVFQFTHPGGVRPALDNCKFPLLSRFNSRTREGCDVVLDLTRVALHSVSIHAPGRGATTRFPASQA